MSDNYSRMMQVIDEVFATRKDPEQLQVTDDQLDKLRRLHPSTLSEHADKNGPLIWALVIPTTTVVMNDFIAGKISESSLLDRTQPDDTYDCLYLCSVTALPEVRGKGITKKLCLDAVTGIRKDHPIQALFAWPFTREGRRLALSLGKILKLQVLFRE